MSKISIIIPTYNRANKLHKSIASVLAQTYIDFELLIIDDGSTDNTQEVVESFGDARIRYIRFAQNNGASAKLWRLFLTTEYSKGYNLVPLLIWNIPYIYYYKFFIA